MAKYHFDLFECGTVVTDEGGIEVEDNRVDVVAAREARAIMAAEVSEGRLCLSCSIEVRDADGRVVLTAPFRELITITGLEPND